MNVGDSLTIANISGGNDAITWSPSGGAGITLYNYFYSIGSGAYTLTAHGGYMGSIQVRTRLEIYSGGVWVLVNGAMTNTVNATQTVTGNLGVGYYRFSYYAGTSSGGPWGYAEGHRSDGVSYRRAGYQLRIINSDYSGFDGAGGSLTAALANAGRIATY